MEWLYGKTLGELREVAAGAGLKPYAGSQIAQWLYKRGATEIDQMTDLSLASRAALKENYVVGLESFARETVSADGTKKYLFPTLGGGLIETAYIPSGERATLCVSCQAGCKMGCSFCMTAKQGFAHNLTSGEILNQMRSIPEFSTLTNLVYMGMGEPLDNMDEVLRSLEVMTSEWGYAWSPTRITLSTAGVLPVIDKFLARTKVHLAVSLHNPFADERAEIMPIEKVWPVSDVVAALKKHDFTHQRRISFEYIVLKGMNDSPRHVKGLASLLNGLDCRINLIRFHAIPGSQFVSPDESAMERFRDALSAKGITTTIRSSRGEDIQAACGLLSTKNS